MPACPVCDTEYDQGQVEDCPNCGWLLKISPDAEELTLNLSREEVSKLVELVRQMWGKIPKEASPENLPQFDSQTEQFKNFSQQIEQLNTKLEGLSQDKSPLQSELEELNKRLLVVEEKLSGFTVINEQFKNLKAQMVQFNQQRQQIQSEREQFKQDRIMLKTIIQEFQKNVQNWERNYQSNPDRKPRSPDRKPSSEHQSAQEASELVLSDQEKQLVTNYNNNPALFLHLAQEVSETEDSISQRRSTGQEIVLGKRNRGNYWILNIGGFDYLVPNQTFKINEFNYKTLEALFICQKYQPEGSRDFKLLKPARVSQVSTENTWHLNEKGILKF
ncbi:MAG: hypothetical protein F6K58_11285 [Symploca sp. SIO2E9]|nr:hypothetical protein [Symploca sp. SIO2E9]